MSENQTAQVRSEKMRSMPMTKLLFDMSLPAVFSMLVLSLYNIVDSIFVARYDAKALTAVSIAFPMQQLMIAFAVGIAVGTSAYVSRKLGQRKQEKAVIAAQTGMVLALIGGAVFAIVGVFASRPFVAAFTNDEQTIKYGYTYLSIVIGLAIGNFLDVLLLRTLQATGNVRMPMLTQALGAATNCVLDPIFIFVFKWGVAGAAIATVFGQFLSMTINLTYFRLKKQEVTVFLSKDFRVKKSTLKGIMKIGLPVVIMNSVAAFVIVILNSILKDEAAITVLGVYFKLQSFVFMTTFGVAQGMLPVLSYNFGAKNRARFVEAYKKSLMFALAIMSVGVLLFQLIPAQLLKMFNADATILSYGKPALRILSICFLFAAVNIISTTVLQALRLGALSMLISLMRQLILLIPSALILSYFFGISGVWFSYPIGEVMVFAAFLIFMRMILNKQFGKAELEELPDVSASQTEVF